MTASDRQDTRRSVAIYREQIPESTLLEANDYLCSVFVTTLTENISASRMTNTPVVTVEEFETVFYPLEFGVERMKPREEIVYLVAIHAPVVRNRKPIVCRNRHPTSVSDLHSEYKFICPMHESSHFLNAEIEAVPYLMPIGQSPHWHGAAKLIQSEMGRISFPEETSASPDNHHDNPLQRLAECYAKRHRGKAGNC